MIIYFAHIAAFALFFAHYCAWDDFTQIGKDEPVHHVKQWLIRAGISVAAIVVISGVGEVLTLKMFILMSVAVAFLFSAWFRYRLNKLRGLDWHYISGSNWYDMFFLWVGEDFIKQPDIFKAQDAWAKWDRSTEKLGGKIAYATEIILTLAAFTVAAILGS